MTIPRSTFRFGRCSLDLAEHRLFRDGQLVPLTPRVFELLRVLVENAGHLVEKDRLLREVWADAFVEDSNLTRAVSVLRKALGETSAEPYIETVPKRGYRFVAPVRHPPELSALGSPPEDRFGLARRITRPHLAGLTIIWAVVVTMAAVAYGVLGKGGRAGGSGAASAAVHRQLTFTGREITPTLSPDGTRLAYVSRESPHRKVVVQDIEGGRRVELFSAPEVGSLRWTPDGTELMFSARGDGVNGLHIAPISGAGARKVADGFFVGCWSPDGSTIALGLFGRGRIVLLDRAGRGQRIIALMGVRDWMWDLDWSAANGRLLVVVDDEQRRPTIWTVRPDGTGQVKTFSSPTEILAARWAPSGDAIYYFTRVNQTVSLYKVSIDRKSLAAADDPTPLVTGLETDEGFGVSADGRRLAYARSPYYSNLWLVETGDPGRGQGTRQMQLTYGTAVIERPRVSPDGQTIVFNMGYESRANLFTIDAAGGAPKQLTFFNAFSVNGAWSANGRSVAFASTEGGKARVWVVNADGSGAQPLSTGDMSEVFDVTWAPGSAILYQQAGNRNFYVIDSQAPRERLLIPDSSVGWAGAAEYSPDGRQIALGWNRRPTPGLWLIDAEGVRETLVYGALSSLPSAGSPIGWSPDGLFVVTVDGKRAAYRGPTVSFEETLTESKILRVPASGGSPTTLLSLPFDEVGGVAMFPDARRFVVSVYSSRSDVWTVDDFDLTEPSNREKR